MNITERLAEALRELITECETNMDFATAHRSELQALTIANEVLSDYDNQEE